MADSMGLSRLKRGITMNCSTAERAVCDLHDVSESCKRAPRPWIPLVLLWMVLAVVAWPTAAAASDSAANDKKIVSALDKEYQKAVEQNDAKTMARILADDFVLVDGHGKSSTKADLVDDAKSGKTHYEHQGDTEQTVRVWGDTAVVTAKLWAKGIEDGEAVNYTLWFSDTYVRTPQGWRYAFAQASLPLPSESGQ